MKIMRSFDGATNYDSHAGVQRKVAADLALRIRSLPLAPTPRMLEIGCGTGFLAAELAGTLSVGEYWMTDISPAMLSRARARQAPMPNVTFAVMDGENPTIDGPFDLICSSLAFQWFADLPSAVERLRKLLSPQGVLVFTTLAAGTFEEWQTAHDVLAPGLASYPSRNMLVDLDLDVTIGTIIDRTGSAAAFLSGLKTIGAGTPQIGHNPLTIGQLRTVMGRFDAQGALASYVVATCVARPVSELDGALKSE